jgi:hypothetical protein
LLLLLLHNATAKALSCAWSASPGGGCAAACGLGIERCGPKQPTRYSENFGLPANRLGKVLDGSDLRKLQWMLIKKKPLRHRCDGAGGRKAQGSQIMTRRKGEITKPTCGVDGCTTSCYRHSTTPYVTGGTCTKVE